MSIKNKKILSYEKILNLYKICIIFLFIIIDVDIYTSQAKPDFRIPFQLLFNFDHKNSIILCGVKTDSIDSRNNLAIDSEQSLLRLVQNEIAAYTEQIKAKKIKIAVLTDKKPSDNDFWNTISK